MRWLCCCRWKRSVCRCGISARCGCLRPRWSVIRSVPGHSRRPVRGGLARSAPKFVLFPPLCRTRDASRPLDREGTPRSCRHHLAATRSELPTFELQGRIRLPRRHLPRPDCRRIRFRGSARTAWWMRQVTQKSVVFLTGAAQSGSSRCPWPRESSPSDHTDDPGFRELQAPRLRGGPRALRHVAELSAIRLDEEVDRFHNNVRLGGLCIFCLA
mmetsp:Transcript_24882/g.53118  ORF Transcript_24882/g.53118 Transcript_24882/m.53118 type:complete len:214 (+) Transcript_24882:558-1199(+)